MVKKSDSGLLAVLSLPDPTYELTATIRKLECRKGRFICSPRTQQSYTLIDWPQAEKDSKFHCKKKARNNTRRWIV